MYGKRRFSKGRSTRRTGGYTRAAARRAFKKVGNSYTVTPRFATVGFARNVEKKYFDKTYQSNSFESLTGQSTPTTVNNGVTYISNTWGDYSFGSQVATASVASNDMLKGVATGTTARTRIGNKLRVSYVKGAFTFTACIAGDGSNSLKAQGGEALVTGNAVVGTQPYLRTSFRFVVVKDLQVNSSDAQVTWNQVFDTTNLQAGVHSELNVDNMGRFVVLEDKTFVVDGSSPQKTCHFMIKGSQLGSVRYNGPSGTALTDKGLYVVWAAFVMGANVVSSLVELPSPVGHSRLCFTDD